MLGSPTLGWEVGEAFSWLHVSFDYCPTPLLLFTAKLFFTAKLGLQWMFISPYLSFLLQSTPSSVIAPSLNLPYCLHVDKPSGSSSVPIWIFGIWLSWLLPHCSLFSWTSQHHILLGFHFGFPFSFSLSLSFTSLPSSVLLPTFEAPWGSGSRDGHKYYMKKEFLCQIPLKTLG